MLYDLRITRRLWLEIIDDSLQKGLVGDSDLYLMMNIMLVMARDLNVLRRIDNYLWHKVSAKNRNDKVVEGPRL
jgi:hypothetical protein